MRNFSSIVRAVALFASAGVVSANQVNVALLSAMGSAPKDNDVVSKLQTNAPFLNITLINVAVGGTAAPDLSPYAAVMVIGSDPFLDPARLGDSLKIFVDAGHGVVIAAFSNIQPNGSPCPTSHVELCGGFLANDYWAIEPGALSPPAHLTLGTVKMPNSPLLANVQTFDGGSAVNYVMGPVNASATDVANWSDGAPLIAIRTIGKGTVIGLNFAPPSNLVWSGFWVSTTDGGKIMANALAVAAGYTETADVPEAQSFILAGAGLAGLSLLLLPRFRRC